MYKINKGLGFLVAATLLIIGGYFFGVSKVFAQNLIISCNNYWYFDNSNISCQQKKFCGSFMYQWLRTFESQSGCQSALTAILPSLSTTAINSLYAGGVISSPQAISLNNVANYSGSGLTVDNVNALLNAGIITQAAATSLINSIVAPPTNTSLTVSLSPSTPSTGNIVAGSVNVPLAQFTFTNPTAVAASVTGLTLLTSSSKFVLDQQAHATDSSGNQTGVSLINSGGSNFSIPSGVSDNLIIPANSSVTLTISGDISTSAVGQNISVVLTGVTASLPILAVFPIDGSTFLIVAPTSHVQVTYPNGGETFQQGQTIPITWSSANMGNLGINVNYIVSIDNNDMAHTIVNNMTNSGSYNWTIPTNLKAGSYKIAIVSADGDTPSAIDLSDNYFTIVDNTSISITSPNGGNFNLNSPIPVSWNMNYHPTKPSINVNLYSYVLGGGYYHSPLLTGVYGSNQYTIPANAAPSAGQFAVQICDSNQADPDHPYAQLCGLSDIFTINSLVSTDTFKIISPSLGEQLNAGQTYTIRWTGSGYEHDDYSVSLMGGSLGLSGVNFGYVQQTDKDVNGFSVTIPSDIKSGNNYYFRFSGKAMDYDSSLFTISGQSSSQTPYINTFSPASVVAGNKVTLYGTNFDQSAIVMVDNGNSPSIVPSVQLDTMGGSWQTISFVIPSNMVAGTHTIKVQTKAASVSNSISLLVTSSNAPDTTASTCDSTAKAIVDSVGGCSNINRSTYSNVYNVCCVLTVTKESLLSLLDKALADGVIDSQEKESLLTALNSYLK